MLVKMVEITVGANIQMDALLKTLFRLLLLIKFVQTVIIKLDFWNWNYIISLGYVSFRLEIVSKLPISRKSVTQKSILIFLKHIKISHLEYLKKKFFICCWKYCKSQTLDHFLYCCPTTLNNKIHLAMETSPDRHVAKWWDLQIYIL